MISKSFLKSSFLYTFSGALPVLSGLALLPFYTNYLSSRDFVAFGFYQGITLLFQILFSFATESYFGVKYISLADEPEKQKRFTGTISNFLFITGTVLLIVSLLAGPSVFSLVFKQDIGVYFWPFGFYSIITGFFNSYFKVYTNSVIYFKKPVLHLSLNSINFILTIGLSVYGLFLYPDTLNGPIYGRLISGFAIFVLAAIGFYRHSIFTFDRSFMQDLTKFCFPFFIYLLANWALSYIDRYFLKSKIDSDTLASYQLILTCYLGVEFIQNGLSSVIYPKVYEIWNRNKKLETTSESNRYFNVFTSVNVITVIAFCLLVPFVVILFVNKTEFYDSFKYLGLISAGFAARGILYFYFSSILFSRKIWIMVQIFSYSTILQILVTWLLVTEYKLPGVIFAGLISKIITVVFAALLTKNNFTYRFNFMKIYGLPLILVVANIILFLVFPEFNYFVYAGELVLFIAIILFVFKNEVKRAAIQYLNK